MSYSYESHFGPASELIEIGAFIQAAVHVETQLGSTGGRVFNTSTVSIIGSDALDDFPEDYRSSLSAECSVADVASPVEEVLSNPTLYAHVAKTHETNVYIVHEHADASHRRKRKRPGVLDPASETPIVTDLQQKLDDIQLKCWPLTLDSALFLRAPKNTDQNVLTAVKKSNTEESLLTTTLDSSLEVLVTVTVYNRLSWGHNVLSRSSQHALLASQTLGDLFEVIPCTSNEIPPETLTDGEVTGYERDNPESGSSGCVMCIEGKAYGDGMSESDYADKLLAHFEKFPSSKRDSLEKAATSIFETSLTSLTIRLNQPYYLLHQGNCEHFIVIEQVRLLHPSDPASVPLAASSAHSGQPYTNPYPLTLQITPPLLPLCRACTKAPAVYSIVGDIRLGESPCVLCKVCWRALGDGDEGVMVVPLPRYELGW